MLFNSLEYLVFLPTVFVLWLIARKFGGRFGVGALLIAASLVFYGWFAPRMIIFIAAMTAINLAVTPLVNARKGGGTFLAVLIIFNFTPLILCKYVVPFYDSLSALAKLGVPLGISYFTFVQVAYIVDTFRGKTTDILSYLLSSVFWAKMVAGPIVRPVAFAQQWNRLGNGKLRMHRIYLGLVIFILGLGKKTILADPLGAIADWGWGSHSMALDCWASWITTLAYSLQLYFDFSGYSDMAWGSAILFNIRLPWNFDSPYKATSIQDFWRRWHITLGLWLRDYLYIPLGGSRKGLAKTIRNVFVTFFLGGVWHGAGWTFVMWGALHGFALAVNNLWRKLQKRRLPKFVGWVLTILFVHFAWVFFRAPDFNSAIEMIKSMANLNSGELMGFDWKNWSQLLTYPFLIVCVLWLWLPNTVQLAHRLLKRRHAAWFVVWTGALCGAVIFLSLITGLSESMPKTPFVYFKF